MNNKIMKTIVPALVAVSSLGAGAAIAGASTTTTMKAHAPKTTVTTAKKPVVVTLAGSVTKVLAAKDTFWMKSGVKTYRVAYSKTTTFSKGAAASLVKGLSVTVTGSYVGKSVSLIKATSIAA